MGPEFGRAVGRAVAQGIVWGGAALLFVGILIGLAIGYFF